MRLLRRVFHHLAPPALLASSLFGLGCTTIPAPTTPVPTRNAASAPAASAFATPDALPPGLVPVVRQGRYTLVELVPSAAQRDLMQQVVDITMPSTSDTTVGDALGYVLLRSGYRVCDSADTSALYALPLPAVHLHLGPLMLRDALQALAGPAWDLSIDEANRQVCFNRHGSPAPGGPAVAPAQSAALPADIRSDPAPLDGLHAWEMQP